MYTHQYYAFRDRLTRELNHTLPFQGPSLQSIGKSVSGDSITPQLNKTRRCPSLLASNSPDECVLLDQRTTATCIAEAMIYVTREYKCGLPPLLLESEGSVWTC